MISTTLRSPWVPIAIAILLQAPRWARADNQAPPPAPPPGYSPPYPPPANGQPPYGPPAGGQPPYGPPAGPPPYGQPPGGQPSYGQPPYGPPAAYPPVNGPEEISEFDDTRPAPYGYTKVSRARKGLIIGGAVTLGSTYLVATFAAAVGPDLRNSGDSGTDFTPLWVPVLGPFLEIGQTDSATARFYLVSLGLGETAGAIMLVYGLVNPKSILVRNDQLTLKPMIGNGASGLSVAGRF